MIVLDLDPILGKTIQASKSMKVISKEDAKADEKEGISPPDDPSLAEGCDAKGLDPLGMNPNATTAGSGVAAIISTD